MAQCRGKGRCPGDAKAARPKRGAKAKPEKETIAEGQSLAHAVPEARPVRVLYPSLTADGVVYNKAGKGEVVAKPGPQLLAATTERRMYHGKLGAEFTE